MENDNNIEEKRTQQQIIEEALALEKRIWEEDSDSYRPYNRFGDFERHGLE